MSLVMSIVRGFLLTIFVVLTPLSVANLLAYLMQEGYELPWLLEVMLVPMITFCILLIITFLFKLWYVMQECPKKKISFGKIFKASIWSPLFGMIGSLGLNLVPFLKAPLMAAEVLGEMIHPIFSKVPEGLAFLPGHFFGLLITTLFGKMMLGC